MSEFERVAIDRAQREGRWGDAERIRKESEERRRWETSTVQGIPGRVY